MKKVIGGIFIGILLGTIITETYFIFTWKKFEKNNLVEKKINGIKNSICSNNSKSRCFRKSRYAKTIV